jgi:hypothetical protein
MSKILFKRLFELRILHGYYIDGWFPNTGDQEVFHDYGGNDPAVRRAQQAFVLENRYDIRQDMYIEPTAQTKRLLDGFQMRTRALPSGLVTGIEVEQKGMGNAARFFPKIPLPAPGNWSFIIRLRNAQFHNFTNHALRPSIPGGYYFTNLRAAEDGKTYPSLSTALPVFSADRTWEMGELIRDGNEVKAARVREGADQFSPIAEFNPAPGRNRWHHFAHSGDRVALPKRFNYRFDTKFDATNPVQNAGFTLKGAVDNLTYIVINKDYKDAATPPLEQILDFRFLPLPAGAPASQRLQSLTDGSYPAARRLNGRPIGFGAG